MAAGIPPESIRKEPSMAFDNEEMKRRRELREKQRQQRIAQQKRLRLRLLIAAAVLVVCGVLIFAVSRNRGSQSTVVPSQTGGQAVQTTAPAAQAEETEVPATTAPPTSTVELTFAGDLNVMTRWSMPAASPGITAPFLWMCCPC